MNSQTPTWQWRLLLTLCILLLAVFFAPQSDNNNSFAYVDPSLSGLSDQNVSVIVTAVSSETAAAAVQSVGGAVTSDLSLINAVGATISAAQLENLAAFPHLVSIVNNHTVTVSGGPDCASDSTDHGPCANRPGWVTDRQEKQGNVVLPYSLKYAAGLAQLPDGGFVAVAEKEHVAFANPDGSIRLLVSGLDFEKMESAPIVTANGIIYFMGELADNSNGKSIVYALDSNGNVLWDYTQKDLVQGLAISPDSAFLYVLGAETKAKLYILDAATGNLLVKAEPPTDHSGLFSQPPVVAADGTVYLQSSGKEPDKDDRFGNVIALDPFTVLQDRKSYLWRFDAEFDGSDTDILYELDLAPLQANGLLYLFSDKDKMVFALDPTNGQLLYSYAMAKSLEAQPAVGPDGTLYLPADKHFYALNADLTLRFDFTFDAKFGTPVFSPDGLVAYTVADDTIQAISMTMGTMLWQVMLNGSIKVQPTVTADGNIIAGSEGEDLVIVTPNGRVTTRLRLDDKFGQVVSASLSNNQMMVLVGEKNLLTIGQLSDTWNPEMVDVQPSEVKDEWEIVNTITIDTGADIVHETLMMQPDDHGDLEPTPITGAGVMIAVIDSGVYVDKHVRDLLSSDLYETDLQDQYVGQYDFVGNGSEGPCDDHDYNAVEGFCFYDWDKSHDPYGHGSHVAGIIWSQITDASTSTSMGIAPGAHVVSVRVLGPDGVGTYEDLIQGIQWVVNNQNNPELDSPIRIMNLSLSAEANVPYFVDPINRAVEQAWANGIVVLAAAGNEGPAAQSITVPGNDPYIITVGAINNLRTPGYWADDIIPSWSASGPTLDGFVKPDVLAPGSQIVSFMHNDGEEIAKLLQDHPDYAQTMSLFRMNGTSMATGVTSGVVALMLQANPTLTPDQVKFRLMHSAIPAATEDGQFHYSPLQQGAGRLWAPEAVLGTEFPADGMANAGMDIASDLSHDWVMRTAEGDPIFDEMGYPVVDEAELAFHYQGAVRSVTSDDGLYVLYYITNPDSDDLLILGGAQTSDMTWVDQQTLTDAGLTFANAGPNQTAWAYGNAWSSGIYNWAGGIYNWAGGIYNWAGGIYNWAGGIYNWAGGIYNWAGGIYNWAGGIYNWAGGIYNWAGGIYNWAGGIYNWAGSLTELTGQSIGANKWVDDDKPEGFTVHVADLDGSAAWVSSSQWQQTVTVTARDEHQTRIEGATIMGTWSSGNGTTSCTTGVNGECSLSSALLGSNVSNVTFTVTGISHDSLTYVAADNLDLEGDSNGKTIAAVRPVQPTVHVSDIDASSAWISSTQWELTYTIQVVDNQGEPAADATVTLKWSKGLSGTFTCLTDGSGQCTVPVTAVSDSVDEVELQVLNVNHWLLVYNSGDNEDADGDSNGTKLVVEPPTNRPSLHVADLDAVTTWVSSTAWNAEFIMTIQDDLGERVANAVVNGIWKSGLSGSFSCTTDESGQCVVLAAQVSENVSKVEIEVTNVAHSMLYYSGDLNDDPDNDSDGTKLQAEPPDYRPGMQVSAITGSAGWVNSGSWTASITFTVVDDNQQPVEGAVIMSKWTKGLSGSVTCTTDASGQCTVSGSLPAGQSKAQLEVLSVTHSMLIDNEGMDSMTVVRP